MLLKFIEIFPLNPSPPNKVYAPQLPTGLLN